MKSYYSKKVIEHFINPKNFGEIKNADGVGNVGNPHCGDIMEIFIKVETKNGKEIIKDIKFQTTGCAAAIATSDMICQLVKGKTVDQALQIDYQDIIKELGELAPIKVHCSVLAKQGLKAAIENYKVKKK